MPTSNIMPASSIRPFFQPKPSATPESPTIGSLIAKLGLQKNPEGGYFVETDRDPLRVPNPFPRHNDDDNDDDDSRSASTTIYYYLTPGNPMGVFHRNRARTVHTLHRGRGRYVIIHADEGRGGQGCRVESFLVGQDVDSGERLQWVVEGGKFKASFLLPDTRDGTTSEGLLISEVSMSHDYLFEEWGFRIVIPADPSSLLDCRSRLRVSRSRFLVA